MTIILNNNSYKYETEAIVKLFIPATRFEFLYEGTDADGDIIMTRIRKCRSCTYIYAYARINKSVIRKSDKLASSDFTDSECEFRICRLLYDILNRLTGIRPQ